MSIRSFGPLPLQLDNSGRSPFLTEAAEQASEP